MPLASLTISSNQPLHAHFEGNLLGGAVVIEAHGSRAETSSWQAHTPYRPLSQGRDAELVKLKAVPYYLWGNRGVGEMAVWIRHT
ncbi:hypothetical protein [Paenibacillus roseipurpureus]|uniref:Non-reducing end beta-L-arabinofuranosidase-like GH127 C-terminal domain-containing protein n=1 Tax=Paenibacillus roseopurpureus TaxID=2918901 RepID=A0AA96RM90_9BACL|nr:hypothetical protein [Paenibacillus sp. MBLB1832]WNR46204.1 hypothetical protein MJB10_08965 [Paenibacillus sp. MBLB1832]